MEDGPPSLTDDFFFFFFPGRLIVTDEDGRQLIRLLPCRRPLLSLLFRIPDKKIRDYIFTFQSNKGPDGRLTTTAPILGLLLALLLGGCQAGLRTTFSGNRLPDIVPGQPGVDYPVASSVPVTQFRCEQQDYPGFFADPQTGCQVCILLMTQTNKSSSPLLLRL